MDTYNNIAKYLSGTSTAKENEELEMWRKAMPENEKEFKKFEKIWVLNGGSSSSFNPDVDLAWTKVSKSIFDNKEATPSRNSARRKREGARLQLNPAFRIAAALLFIIIAGVIYLQFSSYSEPSFGGGLAKEETSLNERREILLSDGTRLWLNEKSSLRFPAEFSGDERIVYLEGEAYFEVNAQVDKPFIVRAGEGEIKVLGTSFNLKARLREKINLNVVEGRVLLSAINKPGTSLILNAGEAAEMENLEIKLQNPNSNVLSWKTGEFIFNDWSLEEVVKSLESYYPVAFKIKDNSILQCRLTARFKGQTIEEVLRIMELTLNLTHKFNKNENVISLNYSGQGPHCSSTNF